MLLGDFFTIISIEMEAAEIKSLLEIHPHHTIFEGHFPGQPVVPGVCMMQMVKEIWEKVTAQRFNIAQASEMKFLSVLDPTKNNRVQANIKYSEKDEGYMMLVASLFSDELTYFKFKGILSPC